MRVLIGFEESGYIRSEFRRFGHDAWSCDLEPAADGSPWHIQADMTDVLKDPAEWHLIICHPPCTYMAVSGNRWYSGTPQREEAVEWTRELYHRACMLSSKVCFEQPVSVLELGPCRQTVQPWMFSYMESKATVLHLRGLPRLKPWITEKPAVLNETVWKMPPSADRSRRRGWLPWLARPMAQQWHDGL